MFGLNCGGCSRILTYPFTCTITGEDGTKRDVYNKVPKNIGDGVGVTLFYKHGDCRKQGRHFARMLKRKK